ncbi:MAG: RNA-binding cell elongation regulator Jag/EloR [Acidimicrobiales bacterium]
MEWVEVTGRTVDEAKEAALEQLGVAEADAELVVVAEPRTGLFGRVRGEARVRARVRPVRPRPKRSHRPGERGRSAPDRASSPRPPAATPTDGEQTWVAEDAGGRSSSGSGTSRSARRRRNRSARATEGGGRPAGTAASRSAGSAADDAPRRVGASQNGSERSRRTEPAAVAKEVGMAEGMTLQEQAEAAREFLQGLLDELGMDASVDTRIVDDETVEVAAAGDELGLLIGPRGTTLAALQDVTRTAVQRRFPTRTDRILVDVAGYRERRTAALQRFSEQVAQEVIESGTERALEPMSPADRKVVHDSINQIDGVVTRSEGEDPSRYIVIAPAG